MSFPAHFAGVLWSKDPVNLDLQADKNYIIHQILMYGTLEDIQFLHRLYDDVEIKRVFLQHPAKIYTKHALAFTRNYILGLEKAKINESAYLTSTPRVIRS